MAGYALTPAAIDDLDEIWEFIARDSFAAADRVESAIFAACELVAANPRAGSIRPRVTELAVRFFTIPRFPNYVIVYLPDTRPVQVIRVLHGRRDVSALL